MKLALLSMSTCQTAIHTLRHFAEHGRDLDLVLVETAQRTSFPATVVQMMENHERFEEQLGLRRPRSWKRRIWDTLPLGLKNAVRRRAERLPGLDRITVSHHARRLGVPVVTVERHSSPEGREALESHGIDYALLASSARLIREPLLGEGAPGIINAHFAHLPRHRALDAMAWSLLDDSPTGLSLHLVDAGIDTGPLLGFHEVPPRPGDTLHALEARMDEEKPPAFLGIVERLERGEIVPAPQDPEAGTHHRPMTVQELLQAESALQRRIAEGRAQTVESDVPVSG